MGRLGECHGNVRPPSAGPAGRSGIQRLEPDGAGRQCQTGHGKREFAGTHTCRNVDFRFVSVRGGRLAGGIEMHIGVRVQETDLTRFDGMRLDIARVRMDERRHRLQRDEEPEHQQADCTVEHKHGTGGLKNDSIRLRQSGTHPPPTRNSVIIASYS